MIPKYSNPSALLTSTTIVSRAALKDESDDELEDVQTNPERARLVARLENMLKRSIDETSLVQEANRHGELSRKKKRRKVAAEEQKAHAEEGTAVAEEVAVPFRLLSGVSQPKPIVLAPKAAPKIISQGPAAEDTEAEAKLRAARARQVAVDYAWVQAESSKTSTTSSIARERVQYLVAQLPDTDAPFLVLERPKPRPKPPRVAQLDPEIEVEPSPHEHEASCCPVVAVREARVEVAKRKRRGGKVRDKPAIQATFWRPPSGVGGKALGYAWGYVGSRPLLEDADGAPRLYERDTMKKAEFA